MSRSAKHIYSVNNGGSAYFLKECKVRCLKLTDRSVRKNFGSFKGTMRPERPHYIKFRVIRILRIFGNNIHKFTMII